MTKLSLQEVVIAAFEEIHNLSDDTEMSHVQMREEGINPELVISFVEHYLNVNQCDASAGDMCLMFEVGWRARKIWERR